MRFLRKFLKNKVLVVSICVIVVSLVYKGVQKAIESYNLKNNNDIVVEEMDSGEEGGQKGDFNDSESVTESEAKENDENADGLEDTEGEIASEETNLELEENLEGDKEVENDLSKLPESNKVISKIYIYITGEVNNPGVVNLDEGSRIVDAINAAGGTTVKADISKVNLVYVLEDGMKVNIPSKNDLKNNSDFEYITMNSGDGGNDDYSSKNSSSGTNASSENDRGNESSDYMKKYDIVNINTATQTELETLPGIGPSLALKIINHRKENGKFSSIEQIKDVSGIGDSKYENLKNYITI